MLSFLPIPSKAAHYQPMGGSGSFIVLALGKLDWQCGFRDGCLILCHSTAGLEKHLRKMHEFISVAVIRHRDQQ